jgi:hypothetical protein
MVAGVENSSHHQLYYHDHDEDVSVLKLNFFDFLSFHVLTLLSIFLVVCAQIEEVYNQAKMASVLAVQSWLILVSSSWRPSMMSCQNRSVALVKSRMYQLVVFHAHLGSWMIYR